MQLAKVKRVVSTVLGEIPIKAKGGTFKPAGTKRDLAEAEAAENIGFTETPSAAELKITVLASLSASDFTDISDDTLTIYLANGEVHSMPQAWVVEAPELGDGEFSVTYNCGKSQKLA